MEGQYSFRGLTIGADTDYIVEEVSGIFARSMALNTPDLPRYHGGLVGASYHNPRVAQLSVTVVGSSGSDFAGKRNAIREAFSPQVDSEDAFVFHLPGEDEQRIVCRCSRFDAPINTESDGGGTVFATFQIQLVASDPVIYDNTLTSLTLDPFTSASGFSWDAVWPIAWGAAGSGGTDVFTNSGSWETWPTFTISGPSSGTLTNPIIENVSNGARLALNANGGVSMTSGQTLVIQSHPSRRSIAFDTGASRRGKLSDDSEWFPLDAGNTELRFRASGTTAGASVLAEARSARI